MANTPPAALMLKKWCGSQAKWADAEGMLPFLRAFAYETPFFGQESQKKLDRVPKNAKTQKHIRRYAMAHPLFGQVLLHEGFMVAPKRWPQVIAEAFPTDAPPTPYECACAFLRSPSPRFWSLFMSYDPETTSAMYWYLAGAHPQALAEALDTTVPTLYRRIASLFSWAGERGKFVIWALSTDLMPIVTNQRRARALAALYRGEPTTKWLVDAKNSFEIYDDIISTPYIQAQLRSRRALHPIPRPTYSPGLVFETLEEKREWESQDNLTTRWLSRWRWKLTEAHPEDIRSWAKLPHRVPVYDRDDPEVRSELRRRYRKRRARRRTASGVPAHGS